MNCLNCGAIVEDGMGFCTTCGAKVEAAQPMGQPVYPTYDAQQMPGGPAFGQQMDPNFNQQMNYGGQTGYSQQPAAPKAPKAPMPKGLKMGLIIGIPSVIVLVILLAVLVPILTRAKLQGEYTYKDKKYDEEYRVVFDEGNYAIYYYDEDDDEEVIASAGTYEYDKKDKEIVMTNIEGDELEAEFDDKDNVVEIEGEDFDSTDKKKTLDLVVDEKYIEDLKDKVDKATADILANDEEAYEDAYWEDTYYFNSEDFDDPEDKFVEELVKALDYENDETLQTLLEDVGYNDSYVEIYVHVGYAPDDYDVDVYVYDYFCY